MVKTKKIICITMLLIIMLVLFAACGQSEQETGTNDEQATGEEPSASEEVIVLKLADHLNPEHPYMANGSVAFMDRVEAESDGRIQFEYYPAEQAGAMKDQVNMVKSGVMDIAGAHVSIFADQLPLSNVACLPGWNANSIEIAAAYHNTATDEESVIYKSDYENNGLRVLVSTAFPFYQFQTSEVQIKSAEDIKGLRLRSPGGSMDLVIAAFGASPIAVSSVELYESMQRGTLDGLYSPVDSLLPQKLNEVTNYCTGNLNVNSFICQWVISEETWDEIPADLQELMATIGNEVSAQMSQTLYDLFLESRAELEEAGMIFTDLPEEDLVALNESCEGVPGEWAEKMNSQGLEGDKVLEEFGAALDEIR